MDCELFILLMNWAQVGVGCDSLPINRPAIASMEVQSVDAKQVQLPVVENVLQRQVSCLLIIVMSILHVVQQLLSALGIEGVAENDWEASSNALDIIRHEGLVQSLVVSIHRPSSNHFVRPIVYACVQIWMIHWRNRVQIWIHPIWGCVNPTCEIHQLHADTKRSWTQYTSDNLKTRLN